MALRRRWPAVLALLATYLLLLLVWRYQAGRFLTPIIPLLLVLMVGGAARIGASFLPGRRSWLVIALTLVLAGGALTRDAARLASVRARDRANPIDSPDCFSDGDRATLRLARWAHDSTGANEIFFTSKERSFFVHSGRRSINQDLGLREPPDSIASFLRSRQVRYAVLSPVGVSAKEHNALLAQGCRDFALVRQFGESTALLRVRAPGEPDDGGATCRAVDRWRPTRDSAR